jgi:hypothetical protein
MQLVYLKLWDLREGWEQDHYDISKEMTLEEISHQLQEPFSTISNHYKSAFRYLIGHDFKPALWARPPGAFKTSRLVYPDGEPRLTVKRPWKTHPFFEVAWQEHPYSFARQGTFHNTGSSNCVIWALPCGQSPNPQTIGRREMLRTTTVLFTIASV